MAVAVSRARELGSRCLVAPTAGNAGGALAAYGAAAGLKVIVAMPSDAPFVHKAEVVICGGLLLLVDGLISDCGDIASEIASTGHAFDVSTLKEPYRLEGKKTMGFEIAESLNWSLPDSIVYPTGGGTGLIGIWKALEELQQLKLIDSRRPRMVAVQAEGCAPIVDAFLNGASEASEWKQASTAAAGLRVPRTLGDKMILDILRKSEGTAIAVGENDISEMQQWAARMGAGWVCPETAAAIAALPELRARGALSHDEHVLVLDTGLGEKYPLAQELPAPRRLRRDDVRELLPDLPDDPILQVR